VALQGLANADHTTLLLNCYTKLKDVDKLDAFILGSGTSGGWVGYFGFGGFVFSFGFEVGFGVRYFVQGFSVGGGEGAGEGGGGVQLDASIKLWSGTPGGPGKSVGRFLVGGWFATWAGGWAAWGDVIVEWGSGDIEAGAILFCA
jgi:hypothetical protein